MKKSVIIFLSLITSSTLSLGQDLNVTNSIAQNQNDSIPHGQNQNATIAPVQNQLQGYVSDANGQPVPGVNIYILDSYDGAASSVDGSFSFQTDTRGDQVLVASSIGFSEFRQKVDVDHSTDKIRIVLKEETQRLDDLVITAGMFDASDEKKSVILKPLDIVTTAGATADIPGVLNTLPGTQTVGETGRLFVRGGTDSETKNYIDGMLVSQPYGLAPNNIPSRMRFSPFLFSGTTFSTGGYSAEYGQALSGTLNLKTDDEAIQTQTDLSFMTVGGGIAHTRKWEKNSIFFETFYANLAPYYWLVPQRTEWERAPSSWQNTFMLRQKVGEKGNLKVFYSGDMSKMNLNQPSLPDVTEQVNVDLSNQYHYLNANYKGILKKYWMVDAGLSNTWSRDKMSMDYYSSDAALQNLHFKFTTIFDKGRTASLKIGTDVFRNDYKENMAMAPENEPIKQQMEEWVPALYLESNIYFSTKFIGVIGGRWEYATLSGHSMVSPRVSLAYKTGDFSQVSLAAGSYHQRPETRYLIFNDNLKDEKAFHYILNFQYSRDNRTFRAEAYYKDYNRLVRYDTTGFTAYRNVNNNGYGYAGGIDIFWRDSQTFRNVDYWLSYSYLDTKRLYRDFPLESIPSFASKHNFSFVYKHFIPLIQTQIGITYSFASPRPYNDPNTGLFNSKRTPAYHDLSMNFSYLVKTNFIIHLSVTNVLGRENIYGYQYSLMPDDNGTFTGVPVGQPAKRFIFLGVFITLSKDNASNQLRNL